ncbi:hypothetical protein PISMIDRAFT_673886 [Pisolithus microcarpus 441]|uniref:Uncharacterized protein n=1 Tax=Pisolithus microcarpus 441 TaxID=765257 RepID=A0A0D0A826_9AGAM|nr:hypothetical protein PISMIDRAFT_673886 [Pisolithus microcarpus 441]
MNVYTISVSNSRYVATIGEGGPSERTGSDVVMLSGRHQFHMESRILAIKYLLDVHFDELTRGSPVMEERMDVPKIRFDTCLQLPSLRYDKMRI